MAMDIRKMLSHVKERTLGKELEDMICVAYFEETDSIFVETEADYKKAAEAFSSTTQEQQDLLAQIEHKYAENRSYAMHYCLSCGLFAGYRQCLKEGFTGENDFHQLVEESLFTMPGMQRHTAYIENIDECHKLMETLEKSLPESMSEHMLSLECAWGERVHHAGLISFYLGYRLALEYIGDVSYPTVLEMVGKQLLTEYSLGLIGTYDQIMRERDLK